MRRVLMMMSIALLAGCGTAPGPAGPAGAPAGVVPAGQPGGSVAPIVRLNATDVMFLQMMVAHHKPAGDMARLANERARDADVKMLAAAIEVTQFDEIQAMSGWLSAGGHPLESGSDPQLHAGHGGAIGNGETEIATLTKSADADFDRTFLNLLIGHQHNAIELAKMELQTGDDKRVRDLAGRIEKSSQAMVELMLRLVAKL